MKKLGRRRDDVLMVQSGQSFVFAGVSAVWRGRVDVVGSGIIQDTHSLKIKVSELSWRGRNRGIACTRNNLMREKRRKKTFRSDESVVLIRMCHLGGQVQKGRVRGIYESVVDIGGNKSLIDSLSQDPSIPSHTVRICQNVMQGATKRVVHVAIQHLYPELHGLSWRGKDGTGT